MEKCEIRMICVDNDAIRVKFRYDKDWKIWLGDYPYFEEEPRRTPSGRLWKNAGYIECPHADPVSKDCGSCPHFKRENPMDLIGVCFHEALRKGAADAADRA